MLTEEEIKQAFLNADPLPNRRKVWKERTLKEKMLFWTKPEIHDPVLFQKYCDGWKKWGSLSRTADCSNFPSGIGVTVEQSSLLYEDENENKDK